MNWRCVIPIFFAAILAQCNDNFHNYKITKYVDSGRFSTVFEVENEPEKVRALESEQEVRDTDKFKHMYMLKVLKPISPFKIQREIGILNSLNGINNVIQLKGVITNNNTTALIFEHLGDAQLFSHENGDLSAYEICFYFKKLLLALESSRKQGVIHRDCKNKNVLINRKRKELRLIDFGLSEIYKSGEKYNPHVASRYSLFF